MRSAHLKQPLTVAVMLLASCSLGLSNSLPPSFASMLQGEGVTFAVAAPEPGVVDPAVVVSELSERPGPSVEIGGHLTRHPFVQTKPATPIFGLLRCTAPPGTLCMTFDLVSGSTRGYYLVLYPEWVGVDGDMAWALVDAHLGAGPGQSIMSYDPRP